jgi:hypothetical protein
VTDAVCDVLATIAGEADERVFAGLHDIVRVNHQSAPRQLLPLLAIVVDLELEREAFVGNQHLAEALPTDRLAVNHQHRYSVAEFVVGIAAHAPPHDARLGELQPEAVYSLKMLMRKRPPHLFE